MVRVLSLHKFAPGSNPILASGQDLFLVVMDSTLLCFVNSQLIDYRQLGLLIVFLLSLNCFFQIIIKSVNACELAGWLSALPV